MTAIPTEPPYSARLRISRAQEHLINLESQIDAFFKINPGTPTVEPDPNGTHKIYKIKFSERFSVQWRILATEIIEHLRASLDHATFATFILATGRLDSNYASFPFGKTPTDLDRCVRGRSKDLRPEIQTLLRSFNAYSGGNDLLYTLNNLSNDCKHGLITFVTGATTGFINLSGLFGEATVEFPDPLVWDHVKNEIAYARTVLSFDFQHQADISTFVAIPDIQVMSTQPATGVLCRMAGEVDRVVLAIEAECRRIGILK